MTQPLLDFRNVGPVFEGIGSGRGAERAESGELPANRGRRQGLFLQRLAPGDDMRSGDIGSPSG